MHNAFTVLTLLVWSINDCGCVSCPWLSSHLGQLPAASLMLESWTDVFFPCSSLPVGFSLVSCCLYGFTYLRIKLKKVAGYCRKSQTENTFGQLLCQSLWKSLKGSHMEKRKCASKKPHTLLSVWRICLHLWFVAGIVRLCQKWLSFLVLTPNRSDTGVFVFTIMSRYNMHNNKANWALIF